MASILVCGKTPQDDKKIGEFLSHDFLDFTKQSPEGYLIHEDSSAMDQAKEYISDSLNAKDIKFYFTDMSGVKKINPQKKAYSLWIKSEENKDKLNVYLKKTMSRDFERDVMAEIGGVLYEEDSSSSDLREDAIYNIRKKKYSFDLISKYFDMNDIFEKLELSDSELNEIISDGYLNQKDNRGHGPTYSRTKKGRDFLKSMGVPAFKVSPPKSFEEILGAKKIAEIEQKYGNKHKDDGKVGPSRKRPAVKK
jgi:hypothetical protein